MVTVGFDEDEPALVLEAVECCGWQLDNTDHVYRPLKEQSHLGASMTVVGEVVGIYTFIRTDSSSRADDESLRR